MNHENTLKKNVKEISLSKSNDSNPVDINVNTLTTDNEYSTFFTLVNPVLFNSG